MSKTVALILTALPLVACASSDVMHVGAKRAPTRPADVRVLLEEPTQPYETLAIIEASDQGWGMKLDALKDKLVKDAAALGGNAVIIGESKTEAGASYFVPAGTSTVAYPTSVKKLTGKVIAWK